ncbi:amidohydrolase family protein [Caulobacter sp. 17J65-9]|uniref:amidohydrolase family protein n=1 Tax=Caulobacter sp. 17J65-9 TaxID=2709382 RepID=UPI0013CCF7B5|nr:amidohydrolase family protein [Caulobacter sp. 17J65-9]NEX94510.1 amidohydrolase family protein [Caulobacter sp. 17J65-9]
MRNLLATTALAALLLATGAAAQTPVSELAKPPADAKRFTIMSPAGRHGEIQYWTAPDGAVMSRMSLLLRGQAWEEDETVRLGADGAIAEYELRGSSPQGDVAETFRVADGLAVWKSQIDGGSAKYTRPAFYLPAGFSPIAGNLPIERMIATGQDVDMLPGGRAHAEKLATATVGTGASAQTVTAWSITGLSGTPFAVWTDANGATFATIGGLSFIRAGYEGDQPALEKAQDEALARKSPELARTLVETPSVPVAFYDVRAFVDGKRFAEHQTVVVDKGKIVAVGPIDKVKFPKASRIVDGKGMTLTPGLWDAHMHVGDDYTGPSELSLGVTSVRDPGNNDALTQARRARRAAGELLSPHVYASSLIDGKGPNTAQIANVAATREEAIQLVDAAKAKGQVGVKFYGTMDPAWIAPAAAEAHKLGLHVHGHVPAGMRPAQAIAAGYDEVTHIYFVAMQAMPDDVVNHSNGIQRFQGVGRYAKDMDLNAEPMKSLIADMAKRGTAVDPTLVVAESLFVPENGDLSPSYAPYVGTLPPTVERGFRQGGFAPADGTTRADFRASFKKLVELVGVMHKAGVPIVAGTDGSGLELVRELELYVEAGFTPAEALAAATSVPARLVGADKHTGTIAVGMDADLVLVDGDPSKTIGDLRHTRLVMMDGKLMEADKLRAAVGVQGRPAFEAAE